MKYPTTIKIFDAHVNVEFDAEIDEHGNLHLTYHDEIVIPYGHYRIATPLEAMR